MLPMPSGYDDWKTASPYDESQLDMQLRAEHERLIDHAGQLAEVEADGEDYTLWFRDKLTAEEVVELLDLRHAQTRMRRKGQA